jgi:hypothetical protein
MFFLSFVLVGDSHRRFDRRRRSPRTQTSVFIKKSECFDV